MAGVVKRGLSRDELLGDGTPASPRGRSMPRDDRAPPEKSKTSRGIDAAVGGATIAAAAYDVKQYSAQAAGAVTGGARNAQKAAKGAGKLAARGASGAAKGLGIANAAAKAAQSPAAAVAGKILNSPLVNGLSRVALPILAARAAYNAYQGYQKDGVRGAVLGAADAATFGLASVGFDKAKSAYNTAFGGPSNGGLDPTAKALVETTSPGKQFSDLTRPAFQPPGGSPRITTAQAERYSAANGKFSAGAQEKGEGDKQATGGPRGFANPATQFAAQSARGVRNISDWARDGDSKGKL